MVKVVAHPAAGDNCALALNIAKQHSLTGNVLSNSLLQNIQVTFDRLALYVFDHVHNNFVV